MKILPLVLLSAVAVAPAIASPGVQPEIGASYLVLRNARLEPAPVPLSVDEPSKVAPFIAVTLGLSDWVGLRLSYHYVANVRATAQFGSPPGLPPSPLPVVVWGHYEDDIHLFSLAPEFKWSLSPKITVAVAPQLNWVASRGEVQYSTLAPNVSLVAGPRERNDEGFTGGGAVRLLWALGGRTTVTLGYQYVDLDPSFNREAHAFSGGVLWKF